MNIKRILSILCVMLLFGTMMVNATDYNEFQNKLSNLSESFTSDVDAKRIIGEAIILIAEFDVLNVLIDKGEATLVYEIKETVEKALKTPNKDNASATISKLQESANVISGNKTSSTFFDVKDNAWYYDAVMYSVSMGIFKGMSDIQFSPDSEITRGMFLALMGRMYKSDSIKYTQGYVDVSGDAYYAEAVNWAKANNILFFIQEDKFYPDRPITREEIVTVLRNCMKHSGKDTEYLVQIKTFSDSSSISDWAKSSVEWASAKKIVSGFEDGSFCPQATATRAQVAQIFYNQR